MDHKNLIYDALGSTSDRVFRWRLLLEEYGPGIIYIKGELNTVADAMSRLDFSPKKNPIEAKQNWMILTKNGVKYNILQNQKVNKTWIQTMCLQPTVMKRKYFP